MESATPFDSDAILDKHKSMNRISVLCPCSINALSSDDKCSGLKNGEYPFFQYCHQETQNHETLCCYAWLFSTDSKFTLSRNNSLLTSYNYDV